MVSVICRRRRQPDQLILLRIQFLTFSKPCFAFFHTGSFSSLKTPVTGVFRIDISSPAVIAPRATGVVELNFIDRLTPWLSPVPAKSCCRAVRLRYQSLTRPSRAMPPVEANSPSPATTANLPMAQDRRVLFTHRFYGLFRDLRKSIVESLRV